MDIAKIKEELKKVKPEIMEKFKVKEIAIFGSYARGEQTDESDIDILVTFEDEATLFDLINLQIFLEERFHRKVDIVSKRALRGKLKSYILSEVITI